MSLSVVAPVRCPHCRNRLTSRRMPWFAPWVRWCKKCRCTVAYIDDHDGWVECGALREDGDA